MNTYSGEQPTLSIITIMRNSKDAFLSTAGSVGVVLPDWCEWVVVDGASTDGSQLFGSGSEYPITKFVSEPDNGISDAFNKGVSMAAGEFVLFLNAGDKLVPDFFDVAYKVMLENVSAPVIVGRISMGGRHHGRRVSFRRQILRNYLPHQAMLIKRSLFKRFGFYNTSFKLGMDYEWSLRLRPIWRRILFVAPTIVVMETGGVSISNYIETYRNYHRARCEHGYSAMISRLFVWFFVGKVSIGKYVKNILALPQKIHHGER